MNALQYPPKNAPCPVFAIFSIARAGNLNPQPALLIRSDTSITHAECTTGCLLKHNCRVDGYPGPVRPVPDERLMGRPRGYHHRLDTATVRTHKLRGKRLIDLHVRRRPVSSTRHRRVACPAEVLRIGQLEVEVPLGRQTRSVTCGVVGDAVRSLCFVGDAALRAGDRLVGGRQIIAKRRPGRETRPPRNRRSMVYANLRLPEARFDRKIGKLRKQAQRPEQDNGCSALTHEARVLPKLHENPLHVPCPVQPPQNNTSPELSPARRIPSAIHSSQCRTAAKAPCQVLAIFFYRKGGKPRP